MINYMIVLCSVEHKHPYDVSIQTINIYIKITWSKYHSMCTLKGKSILVRETRFLRFYDAIT